MSSGRRWVHSCVRILRPLAWLWPGELRAGRAEWELVLEEVLTSAYAELGPRGLLRRSAREAADALLMAVRLRPAAATLMAMLLVLGGESLRARHIVTSDAIVVRAADPAGEFTLTLDRGRLVAASVDRVDYPADRLVQTADSLHVLDAAGRAIVAVAFEAPGTVRWEPRVAGP